MVYNVNFVKFINLFIFLNLNIGYAVFTPDKRKSIKISTSDFVCRPLNPSYAPVQTNNIRLTDTKQEMR